MKTSTAPAIPKRDASSVGTALLTGLSIVIIAILLQSNAALAEAFLWDRSQEAGLSVFRGFTTHLVHWSWDHLWWDLAAFTFLSAAVIQLRPDAYLRCLIFSAIAIIVGVVVLEGQLDTYAGLSGIDSALFGLTVCMLWERRGGVRWLALSVFPLFIAKCLFEWATGGTLFVDSRAENGFVPVPSAHLIGALAGMFSLYRLPITDHRLPQIGLENSE